MLKHRNYYGTIHFAYTREYAEDMRCKSGIVPANLLRGYHEDITFNYYSFGQ